jgi:hypothetical protein
MKWSSRPGVVSVEGLKAILAKIRELITWYRLRTVMTSLRPLDTGVRLIRFGPQGDGGYLIPDELEDLEACFSPGVFSISGFEKDCAERGLKVFLADASVEGPAETHELFHFSKIFIGGQTQGNFFSLADWVAQSGQGNSGDLLLQMDIEGGEYEVIRETSPDLLKRFRIMVIEFHGLDDMNEEKRRVLQKILKTHACLHLHPNNCLQPVQFRDLTIPPVMEFTFLRRDRIRQSRFREDFPHPLDCDNTFYPTFPLPECWYR